MLLNIQRHCSLLKHAIKIDWLHICMYFNDLAPTLEILYLRLWRGEISPGGILRAGKIAFQVQLLNFVKLTPFLKKSTASLFRTLYSKFDNYCKNFLSAAHFFFIPSLPGGDVSPLTGPDLPAKWYTNLSLYFSHNGLKQGCGFSWIINSVSAMCM